MPIYDLFYLSPQGRNSYLLSLSLFMGMFGACNHCRVQGLAHMNLAKLIHESTEEG